MISEIEPVRGAQDGERLTNGGPASEVAREESHRQIRKRYVVRSAQLAMGILVGVAVVATLATGAGRLSAARLVALAATGCAYVGWTLYGTRDAARFALWHHRLGPALAWPLPSGRRAITHLTVQFGL